VGGGGVGGGGGGGGGLRNPAPSHWIRPWNSTPVSLNSILVTGYIFILITDPRGKELLLFSLESRCFPGTNTACFAFRTGSGDPSWGLLDFKLL